MEKYKTNFVNGSVGYIGWLKTKVAEKIKIPLNKYRIVFIVFGCEGQKILYFDPKQACMCLVCFTTLFYITESQLSHTHSHKNTQEMMN